MAREENLLGVILKKQPYGEGDEFLTVFTNESGKLRLMAKSTKFAKSKLQYSLQTLFLVKLAIASRSAIPRIIGAEVAESFAKIRENLKAANAAIYASELVMKFTPDEQKNQGLFNLLVEFLNFLNSAGSGAAINWGLLKFKIEFLDVLGMGIHYAEPLAGQDDIGFSNSLGSFTQEDAIDYVKISQDSLRQFVRAQTAGWEQVAKMPEENLTQIHNLLSDFLSFHLERNIQSERFLEM